MEYSVGGGIIISSRLMTGAGYTLKVPAIDLAEVGAGGGSIIWIDAGGALKIGPQSAGASPGPVCYDIGGTEPTVTDANVVLGYINPAHLVGGALKLKAEKSRAAIEEKIAKPLKLPVEQAAYGAHVIAASNMIRAIRAVSSERGRDPREYTLVGFGGNGPIFASVMAQTLQISRVMIPPSAGVFSAIGLLCADVEYHLTKTRLKLLRAADPVEIASIFGELESEARARLAADNFPPEKMQITRSASMHYQGQSDELEIEVPGGALTREALAGVEEAFNAEHERTYGHRASEDEPIEVVSLRVVGRGMPDISRAAEVASARLPENVTISNPVRRAYFGQSHGWLESRIVNRSELAAPHQGPCIVEEYDSTCVIPPGCTASLDSFGNIVIAVSQHSKA
jgi:N-methylhydantoinase A